MLAAARRHSGRLPLGLRGKPHLLHLDGNVPCVTDCSTFWQACSAWPRPVTGVTPIAINRGTGEVGQWGYMAGFGSTGTGRTGNSVNTSLKRAGVNVIDATVATISFPERFPAQQSGLVGSSRALLTDFDNSAHNSSTLGAPDPLNMEYTTAKGDSGGPLLLYRDGVFRCIWSINSWDLPGCSSMSRRFWNSTRPL
jgi:hypothetical protein